MPLPARRTSTRPRTWSVQAMTSLVALLLVVIGVAPAGAAAGSAPFVATPASTADPAEGDAFDLTLVTGDTVHVTVSADGRQMITVTPAPRQDGTSPAFWTHRRGDDLYVVPQDVADLIPQRLDPALFNMSTLMEVNEADTDSSSLPLIVTYQPDARVRARSLPSTGKVRQLESVNGFGMRIDKEDDTAVIRQALDQLGDLPQARTLASGPFANLEKIWLDRPIEAALDHSVGQIGAPAAWQQGYDGDGVTVAVIDSGIDADHPDMAGKVVAARNFSSSDTADDVRGHGTHVASTIAGSGEASGGQYTGVAPGVDLINGKVLDDFGNGSTSDLIDAMEWAAQQGADIVNLSLGVRGRFTDGTDPGSMAVNALTEQYGTLVVVAAGNDGPNDSTVTTPGTADKALTVGAVDDDGQMAGFSSRGPRAGDLALKPDIVAPGVGIVAARADGTSMGEPVNEHYTSENGTSMATPHVVGVAALAADAQPDLDAMQLKSLLMGTASPNDLGIFAEGAGMVDVPAALAGTVLATPASVGFGDFGFPHDQRDPLARTLTYTNFGDAPQTLALTVDAANDDGEAAPEEALTLSTQSLTVPAGGSANVTVTLDTSLPGTGQYGGAIVAQPADGDSVRTPVGFHKEPDRYNLRVEGIARDGREALGRFSVLDVVDGSVSASRAWGDSDDMSCTTDNWAQNNCVRVAPGTYSVSGLVFTMPEWAPSTQEPGQFGAYRNTTVVAEPEITIDSNTTLTLDARDATEVQIDTPDHETKRNVGAARQISFHRAPENGQRIRDSLLLLPRSQLEDRLFMQPTDEVTHGRLAAYTRWQLEAPAITFDVVGSGSVELNPLYYDRYWFSGNSWQFPMLEGSHQLPVVDAGTATAEEIDGLDLDGALALIRRSDAVSVADQSNNAAAAGAALVAIYNDVPGSNSDPGGTEVELQVPTVRLSHAEGTSLRQQLPVTVGANGQPASPYRYNLAFAEEQGIPPDLHYVADADQLAAVENAFHSQLGEELTLTESVFTTQPWESFASSFPMPSRGGAGTRTDYYVASPGTTYDQRVTTPESKYNFRWPDPPRAQIFMESGPRTFQPGERVQRSWFEATLRPGPWPSEPVQRAGHQIDLRLAAFVDGAGNFAAASTSWFEGGFDTRLRMYADDELLAEGVSANGFLTVPSDTENVRFEYEVDNAPWAELSTRTRSVWTFRSPPLAAGQTRIEPLLTVDYDVDVDEHNRLQSPPERRGPHTVEFTVGHQTGAPSVPIRSDASLEVSYDGGDSWRTVHNLREVAEGEFVAYLRARAPRDGDGTVSLRIRAEDRAGNTIEQEIIRAYGM